MATRMQQRRGTAAQWSSADPILAAGEIGFETDTGKFKIGNGSSAWAALTYFADVSALVDGAPELLDTLNELAAAIGDDPDFLNGVAPLNSPALTGEPTAPTPDGLDNSTKLATTAFVQTKISNLVNSAPAALDTLNELSAALNNDADFATTVTNSLADKVNKSGDTMTGALTLSGAPSSDLHASTKKYVDDELSGGITSHNAETTNVHGIADTSALALTADVEAHTEATTNVHGIADTAVLLTTEHSNATTNVHGIADTSALATSTDVSDAVSAHSAETTNVHGIADTAALVLTDDARLSDTRTPSDTSVTTNKIVDGAVTAVKLAADSVTSDKIEDGAVTSGKIADGAIVNADINASAAIDWSKLAASATVSATELGYVAGVTSSIQTQLDATNAAIATAKSEAIADATAQVSAVIDSAPGALDTLNELAAALGDDANFASTVTTALDGKVASYTPISQKTAAYTLSALTERDTLIELNSSSALTLTIPTNSSVAYPVGTSLDILQVGTGQVTIAGASGVTVNGTPGLKLRAQWSSATLFKRAENTWIVMGDLSA